MLIEKEVIRPGVYWYRDEVTGLPRKLTVTPELTSYWHDQGSKMLSSGLTVPVPFEHDFSLNPMTPKDKLVNNAGWVKEYRRHDGKGQAGDRLFAVVDVQDDEVAKKLPRTIRWTSPWINSFTDGKGQQWNNVISHLALTTRPRIVEQEPFPNVAAALSLAADTKLVTTSVPAGAGGFCLSRAGLLAEGRKSKQLRPCYPLAFSLWGGGIPLADFPPPKKGKGAAAAKGQEPPPVKGAVPEGDEDDFDVDPDNDAGGDDLDMAGLMNPAQDANGDVKMEELLCDLLQALGVPMPDESNEVEFKRHLYEAAMSKIKELAGKGMAPNDPGKVPPDQNKPPTQQPHAAKPGAPNPLIPQQEQQPMYMGLNGGQTIMAQLSLDDINKIEDSTMRTVALAMYTENEKLRAQVEANNRVTNAMRQSELDKETRKRAQRIALLGRLSPKIREDLDAMAAVQGYALAMGDDGRIVDPMKQTLDMLEKGLASMPSLLTTDMTALSTIPHPTDADQLTPEAEAKLVDDFARGMGCLPARAG